MNLIDKVILVHEYFHKKIYNSQNYTFNPSAKQRKMLVNFCELLESHYGGSRSIGDRLLVDYFAYQHLRWVGKTDTVFGNTVMLGWLVGKKAFLSWISRAEGSLHVAREKVLARFKIAHTDIFGDGVQIDYNKLEEYEENVKHHFKNSEDLFAHCLQGTTLYNKRSKHCMLCSFRNECKDVQKEVYPLIHVSRNAIKDTRV